MRRGHTLARQGEPARVFYLVESGLLKLVQVTAEGRAGGQNIAMAPSAAIAFRTMLNSPPHRRNMLASAWRFGGVGAARGCDGQIYFTVNFLAP